MVAVLEHVMNANGCDDALSADNALELAAAWTQLGPPYATFGSETKYSNFFVDGLRAYGPRSLYGHDPVVYHI